MKKNHFFIIFNILIVFIVFCCFSHLSFAIPLLRATPSTSPSLCNTKKNASGKVVSITCPHSETFLTTNFTDIRKINYQLPVGNPPQGGWPTVIIYQGTLYPVEFTRKTGEKFNMIYEVALIRNLLDKGFAVIAPMALLEYGWQTNLIEYGYEFSLDYAFI